MTDTLPLRTCKKCRIPYQRLERNDVCPHCYEPRYCKDCGAAFWNADRDRARCHACVAKLNRTHKGTPVTLTTSYSNISPSQEGTLYYTPEEDKRRREELHKRLFGERD